MSSEIFLKVVRFKLKGERIILRPLKRDDIDKRLRWKKYSDPLYSHYNLEEMTATQKKQWYLKRKKDPQMLYLTIESLSGELLGFLNLYALDWAKRKGKLGIFLGCEYTNKGYGVEAIETLLPYYFEKMKFKELSLDVASHNWRAMRCYQKCGFEFARTFFNRHDPRSKLDIFGESRFLAIRKYFKKEGDEILVQFEEMRITSEMWEKMKTSQGFST